MMALQGVESRAQPGASNSTRAAQYVVAPIALLLGATNIKAAAASADIAVPTIVVTSWQLPYRACVRLCGRTQHTIVPVSLDYSQPASGSGSAAAALRPIQPTYKTLV